MTYIASFFHAFSTMDQAETVSRRVEKFSEIMHSIWLIRSEYEKRTRTLLASLSSIQTQWSTAEFSGSYTDAKSHAGEFTTYKKSTKRGWVSEKQDIVTLLGNVQTKLKTYGL